MTKPFLFLLLIVCPASCLLSCNQSATLSSDQVRAIDTAVVKFAMQNAKDLDAKGPVVWLDYFENSPEFFMASDGNISFTSYEKANKFIKNILVKQLKTVRLTWKSIRVDPLTPDIAILAADYHEDLTDSTGSTHPYDGFFTATVHQTATGWKYRDMHWSSISRK